MKKLVALAAVVACAALFVHASPAAAQSGMPDFSTSSGITGPHVAAAPIAPVTSSVTLPIRFDADAAGALVTLGASQWLAQYTLPALERTWIGGANATSAVVRRANLATVRRR